MTAPPKKQGHFLVYMGVVVLSLTAFLYLVFGSPSFLAIELSQSSPTMTITQSTTAFSTISTTETATVSSSSIETTFVTVTQQLPPSVTLSGDVKTRGPNTTPTDVLFTGAKGTVFRAEVIGIHYGVTLDNSDSYQVKIHYKINPVGEGDCMVGTLLIDTTANSLTANLEC